MGPYFVYIVTICPSPVPNFCFVVLQHPLAAHANPIDVKSTVSFRSVKVQDHPISVNLLNSVEETNIYPACGKLLEGVGCCNVTNVDNVDNVDNADNTENVNNVPINTVESI